MNPDKEIDYLGLLMAGVLPSEVPTDQMAIKAMDFENSYATAKPAFDSKGIDKDAARQIYDQAYTAQSKLVKRNYDEMRGQLQKDGLNVGDYDSITEDENGKLLVLAPPSFLIHPRTAGLAYTGDYDIIHDHDRRRQAKINEAYDVYGNKYNFGNLTNEQMAERKGVYIPKGAKMRIGKDGKPNTEEMYGDLLEYAMMDHLGNPFRIDENGNRKMLVLGQDPTDGLPVWKEDDQDAVVSADLVRSMYGPKKQTSGAWRNFVDHTWNGMMDWYGAAGSISATIGQWGKDLVGTGDGMVKWGDEIRNRANISKSKISEAAGREGMFDSWRGFTGIAGTIVSNVLPQMGVARLAGAAASMIGSAYKAQIAMGASYTMGAGYALHAFNEEGIKMGIPAEDRKILNLAAASTMLIAEYALNKAGASGIMDRALGNKSQRELIEAQFQTEISAAVKEAAPAMAQAATAAEKQKIAAEVAQKTSTGILSKLGYAVTAPLKVLGAATGMVGRAFGKVTGKIGAMGADAAKTGWVGRTKAAISAGWEEGWEEVLEGWGNNITKSLYNTYGAEEGARIGQGKFHVDTSIATSIEEFAAGFLGGNLAGAISGGGHQDLLKYGGIANLVMESNSLEDAHTEVMKMWDKGVLDNPYLTESGTLRAGEAMSRNDAAKEAMKAQVTAAYKMKEQYGFNAMPMIQKLLGGDAQLAKDVLTASMVQQDDLKKLAELEAQMQGGVPMTAPAEHVQAQYKELKDKTEAVRTKLDAIFDGSYYANYLAESVIQSDEAANHIGKAQAAKGEALSLNEIDTAIGTFAPLDEATVKERVKEAKAFSKEVQDKYNANVAKMQSNIDNLSTIALDPTLDLPTRQGRVNSIIQDIQGLVQGGINLSSEQVESVKTSIAPLLKDAGKVVEDLHKTIKDKYNPTDNTYKKKDGTIVESTAVKDVVNGQYDLEDLDGDIDTEEYEDVDAWSNANAAHTSLKEAADGLSAKPTIALMNQLGIQAVDSEDKLKKYKATLPTMVNGKGERTILSQADYDKAIQNLPESKDANGNTFYLDANGNRYELSKEHDKYATEESTYQLDEKGEIMTDKDGNPIIQDTQVALQALEVSPMLGLLFRDLAATQALLRTKESEIATQGTSESLVNEVQALYDQLSKRAQAVADAIKLSTLNKHLSDKQKATLGITGIDLLTDNDLKAYGLTLAAMKGYAKDILFYANQTRDVRRMALEKYDKENTRIQAHLLNSLLDAHTEEARVGATVLTRPAMLDVDKATKADVYKAMQYWHFYFNTKDSKGAYLYTPDAKWIQSMMTSGFKNMKTAGQQGMFTDTPDSFTLENFIKDSDGDTGYKQIYVLNFVRSMVSADPKSYFDKIVPILQDPLYKGAHTPEQLATLFQAYAHVVANDRDAEFKAHLQAISMAMIDKNNAKVALYLATEGASRKLPLAHILVTTGNAGAGKTTYVIQSLLQAKATNKKVLLVAPYAAQLDSMKAAAARAGMKLGVDYEVLTADKYNPADHNGKLIIIDELSLIPSATLDGYRKIPATNTVILMGDVLQVPANIAQSDTTYHLNGLYHTFNMTMVMRSNVADVARLQNAFRKNAFGGAATVLQITTRYQTGAEWEGVRNYRDNSIYEDALTRQAALKGKKDAFALIVWDEAAVTEAIAKGIDPANIYSMTGTNTPQGREWDEVFVVLPENPAVRPDVHARFMLTAVSRGMRFVAYQFPSGESTIGKVEKSKDNSAAIAKDKAAVLAEYTALRDALPTIQGATTPPATKGTTPPATGTAPNINFGKTPQEQVEVEVEALILKGEHNKITEPQHFHIAADIASKIKNGKKLEPWQNSYYQAFASKVETLLKEMKAAEDAAAAKNAGVNPDPAMPVVFANIDSDGKVMSNAHATTPAANLLFSLTKVAGGGYELRIKDEASFNRIKSDGTQWGMMMQLYKGLRSDTTWQEYLAAEAHPLYTVNGKGFNPPNLNGDVDKGFIPARVDLTQEEAPKEDEGVQDTDEQEAIDDSKEIDTELEVANSEATVDNILIKRTQGGITFAAHPNGIILFPKAHFYFGPKSMPVVVESISVDNGTVMVSFTKDGSSDMVSIDDFMQVIEGFDTDNHSLASELVNGRLPLMLHAIPSNGLPFAEAKAKQREVVKSGSVTMEYRTAYTYYDAMGNSYTVPAIVLLNESGIEMAAYTAQEGAIQNPNMQGYHTYMAALMQKGQELTNASGKTAVRLVEADQANLRKDQIRLIYLHRLDSNATGKANTLGNLKGRINAVAGTNLSTEESQLVEIQQVTVGTTANGKNRKELRHRIQIGEQVEEVQVEMRTLDELPSDADAFMDSHSRNIAEAIKSLNGGVTPVNVLNGTDLKKTLSFVVWNMNQTATDEFENYAAAIYGVMDALEKQNAGAYTLYNKDKNNIGDWATTKDGLLAQLKALQEILNIVNASGRANWRFPLDVPTTTGTVQTGHALSKRVKVKKGFEVQPGTIHVTVSKTRLAELVDATEVEPPIDTTTSESDFVFSTAESASDVDDTLLLSDEQVVAEWADILGNTALQITGERYTKDGKLILGSVTAAGIAKLTRLAKGGVSSPALYHEAMHVVLEFLATDAVRSQVYAEIKSKTGKTGVAAAEHLSEEAERYAQERRNLKGWSKWIRSFMDWFNYFKRKVLPGFASAMEDILFNTFVSKAYRDVPFQRDAAALDTEELFKSEKVRGIDNILRRMAGIKDLALQVRSAMGRYMSGFFLDARLTKGSIRNAVQGADFMAIFANTDSLLRAHLLNYAFSKIGTAESLKVNGKELFRITEGVHEYMNAKGVYMPIPTNNEGITFPHYADRSYIRRAMNQAFADVEVNGMTLAELMNPDNAMVLKAIRNSEVFTTLVLPYAMLDDEAFMETIAAYFPNLPIRDMWKGEEYIRKRGNVAALLDHLRNIQDSVSKRENEETNQMDKQSDLVKFAIATTRDSQGNLVNVNAANKMFIQEMSDLLGVNGLSGNWTKLFAEHLSNRIAELTESYAASESQVEHDYLNLLRAFYNRFFSKEIGGGQMSHYALVFQMEALMKLRAANPAKFKEEAASLYNRLKDKKKISEDVGLDEFTESIPDLLKHSQSILNAITTHFRNIGTDRYAMLYKDSNKLITLDTSNVYARSKQFNDQLAKTFMTSGTVGKGTIQAYGIGLKNPVLHNHRFDTENPTEAEVKSAPRPYVEFRADGIYYRADGRDAGKVILGFSGINSEASLMAAIANMRPILKAQGFKEKDVIKHIYQVLGLKFTPAMLSTISQWSSGDVIGFQQAMATAVKMTLANYVTANKLHYGKERLDTDMGTFYINRNNYPEYPQVKYYNELLQGIVGENNTSYGREPIGNISNMSDRESQANEDEGDKEWFATGFFKEVLALANVSVYKEGGNHTRSLNSVKSQKIYIDTTQDALGKYFVGGENNAIVSNFEEFASTGNVSENFNIDLSNGAVLNPVFGTRGFVNGMFYIAGVKTSPSNGSDLSDFTTLDNFDFVQSMMDSALATQFDDGMPIPLYNQAHRTRQRYAMVNFRVPFFINKASNGLLVKTEKDGKATYALDTRTIAYHAAQRFGIEEQAQIQSINRWATFLNEFDALNPGAKLSTITHEGRIADTIEPLTPVQLQDYAGYRALIGTYMKHINTVLAANVLTEQHLNNNRLLKAKDLIEVFQKMKKEVNGKFVDDTVRVGYRIGFDTNMNGTLYIDGGGIAKSASSVFNYNHYSKKVSDFIASKMGEPSMSIGRFMHQIRQNPDILNQFSDTEIKAIEYLITNDLFGDDLQFVRDIAKKEGFDIDRDNQVQWAAQAIGHQLFNDYLQFATMGTYNEMTKPQVTVGEFGSVEMLTNANKRFLIPSSPVQFPQTDQYYTIDKESPFLILADVFNQGHDDRVNTFDGQEFTNPLMTVATRYSLGGSYGLGDTQKAVSGNYDVRKGSTNLIKRNSVRITTQSVMDSPTLWSMLEMMLNPSAVPYQEGIEKGMNIPDSMDSMWARFRQFLEDSRYTPALDFIRANATRYNIEVAEIDAAIAKLHQAAGMTLPPRMLVPRLIKALTGTLIYKHALQAVHPLGSVEEASEKAWEFYCAQRSNGLAGKYPYHSHVAFQGGIKQESLNGILPWRFNANMSTRVALPLFPELKAAIAVGQIMPPTDLLEAYKAFQQLGIPFPYQRYAHTRFNTLDGQQLNPNRPTDDTIESPMVQLMSIVLAHPANLANGRTERITQLLSTFIGDAISNFNAATTKRKAELLREMSEVNDDELSAVEKKVIDEYVLQHIIRRDMRQSDDTSQLSMIIESEGIGLNFSGVQTIAFRYLSAWLRREAIKRKMKGMRLVQAVGNLVATFDVQVTNALDGTTESVPMTQADMLNHLRKLGLIPADASFMEIAQYIEGLTKGVLNGAVTPVQQAIADAISQGIISMPRELHYAQLQENEVQQGEAVVPAALYKKYSIPDDITFQDVFTTYKSNGETLRWYNLATKETRDDLHTAIKLQLKGLVLPTFAKGEVSIAFNQSHPLYDDNSYFGMVLMKAYQDYLLNHLGRDFKKQSADLTTDKQYGQLLNSLISAKQDELISSYVDALISIRLTTEQFLPVRTPSGPGSGSYAKVIGFINDNGSYGYMNSVKNIIDGSDNDVDQWTGYYLDNTPYAIGKTAERSADDINNDITQELFDYYNDPECANFTLSAIQLERIKDLAKAGGGMKTFLGSFNGMNNIAASFIFRTVSMQGMVVGPFALAQKGQTFMYSSTMLNDPSILNMVQYGFNLDNYEEVPVHLEAMVNAATDNPKLVVLGQLRIGFDNADMVASMFFADRDILQHVQDNYDRFGFDNVSKVNIYTAIASFLKSQAHIDVMEAMKKSSSWKDRKGKSKSKKLYHQIHSYINAISKKRTNSTAQFNELAVKQARTTEKLYGILKGLESMGVLYEVDNLLKDKSGAFKIKGDLYKLVKKQAAKEYQGMEQQLVTLIKAAALTQGEMDETQATAIVEGMIANASNVSELGAIAKAMGMELLGNDAQQRQAFYKQALFNLNTTLKEFYYQQGILKSIEAHHSEDYLADLHLMAKYAMLGDFQKRIVDIVNINQGTKSDPYLQERYLKNLEFMTGMPFDELLSLYKDYQRATTNGSIKPHEFLASNMPSLKERQDYAFGQYRHRMATSDFAWMNQPVQQGAEVLHFRDQFHAIGNVPAMLFARPDIMSMIESLKMLIEVEEKSFTKKAPVFQDIRTQLLEDGGMDVFNEAQYYVYEEQVDQLLLADFLHSPIGNRYACQVMQSLQAQHIGTNALQEAGYRIDVSTPAGRAAFIAYFADIADDYVIPKLTEVIKNSPNKEAIAFFMARLDTDMWNGNIRYVGLKKELAMTDLELSRLREGFAALPQDIRNLFTLYQIAKDGFNYKQGLFAKILDTDIHKLYSDYLLDRTGNGDFGAQSAWKDRFVKQLKANIGSGLLRMGKRAKMQVERGGNIVNETIYLPPASANGFATSFYEPKYVRYTKYGKKQMLVQVEAERTVGMTSFIQGSGNGGNMVNMDDHLLGDKQIMVTSPINGEPMPLFTYYQMFVKGNYELLRSRYVNRRKSMQAREERITGQPSITMPSNYNNQVIEVSTRGDDFGKQFSALNATIRNGFSFKVGNTVITVPAGATIEQAYQLDVKGYRRQGNDWKLGKGKEPLNKMSPSESYEAYKKLWQQWASENTGLMQELTQKVQQGARLVDSFANTPISQARVLSELTGADRFVGTPALSSDFDTDFAAEYTTARLNSLAESMRYEQAYKYLNGEGEYEMTIGEQAVKGSEADSYVYAELYNQYKARVVAWLNEAMKGDQAPAILASLQAMKGKTLSDSKMYGTASPATVWADILNTFAANNLAMNTPQDILSGLTADAFVNAKPFANQLYTKRYFRLAYGAIANPYDSRMDNVVEMHLGDAVQPSRREANELMLTQLGFNAVGMFREGAISSKFVGDSESRARLVITSISNKPEVEAHIQNMHNGSYLQFYKEVMQGTHNFVDYDIDAATLTQQATVMKRIMAQDQSIKNVESTNILKLTRLNGMPMRVGDTITFANGMVGRITYIADEDKQGNPRSVSYALDPTISNTHTLRAKVSIHDALAIGNSKALLQAFAAKVAQAVPNIQYQFITQEQALSMGEQDAVSFVQDGIIYLNSDRADTAVILHEFAHPLVLAYKHTNRELYNRLASLLQDTSVERFVRSKYPELSEDQLMDEMIPTYLQMRAYERQDATEKQGVRGALRKFFDWVKSFFKDVLGGPIQYDSTLDQLDFAQATLGQIGDAILNDLQRGKFLSDIDSEQVKGMASYTLKAAASSKLKNFNIDNIDSFFRPKANLSKDDEAKREIQHRISKAMDQGNMFFGLSGSYNLNYNQPKYYQNGQYQEHLRQADINSIVAKEVPLYENIQGKTLDFLQALSATQKKGGLWKFHAAKATLYPELDHLNLSYKEQLEQAQEADVRLTQLLESLDFNPQADIATDVKGMATLGYAVPTNIGMHNALIIIHDHNTPDERISIYSITNSALSKGANVKLGSHYLQDGLSDIHLMEQQQDINAVKNTILAMTLSQERPKMRISRIGSIGLYGQAHITHFKDMDTMLPQVRILMQDSLLSPQLERDLYGIVHNEELYDADRYDIGVFQRIKSYAQTQLQQTPATNRGRFIFERMLEQFNGDNDYSSYDIQLAKLLRRRMDYILFQELGGDTDIQAAKVKAAKNNEYNYLGDMYLKLTERKYTTKLKDSPLTIDESWLQTADRWGGRMQTYIYNSIDLGLRKAKASLFPFVQENDTWVQAIQKQEQKLSKFNDQSKELFYPIFKKSKAIQNGQEVDVSLHEIHWDENDATTKAMLADPNSGLTNTMVAYGKWLMDTMEAEFEEYLYKTKLPDYLSKVGTDLTKDQREAKARQLAKLDVARRWKKGMLPAMPRRYTEAIAAGEWKDSAQLFFSNVTRMDNPFDEYYRDDTEAGYQKLTAHFWSQFQSADLYGGLERLRMLGMDVDSDGKLVVLDADKQRNLSYNLQNIGNYTVAASTRAREMGDTVDAINTAIDYLTGLQAMKGVDTTDLIKQMQLYIDRQVFGDIPKLGQEKVLGMMVNMDNAINAGGMLVHMIHLAASPVLAAKNVISSNIKMATNALVNGLAGTKLFTLTDVSKAAALVFSNPALAEAINQRYQLVAMSERDIINSLKYNTTRFTATDTDTAMIGHFFGDYYTQLVGVLAQMNREGTLDAHTLDAQGNLAYDHTKDSRFYTNGELTSVGGHLLRDLVQSQIREGYHDVSNGVPGAAYSQGDENRIKTIAQRYVGELNDNQLKNRMAAFGLPRVVMTMRNYLYNLKQYWWKESKVETMLGDRKVIINKEGKEEVVWDAPVAEGVIQTVFHVLKTVATHGLSSPAELANISDYQKRNLVSLGAFGLVVGGLYLLLDGMLDKDDDDEESPYYRQLLRSTVMGGVGEQLTHINPASLYTEATNTSAMLLQVQNVWNFIKGTATLPYDMTTEEDAQTAIRNYLYITSKNIPYGTFVRNTSNAVEGIWNDFSK